MPTRRRLVLAAIAAAFVASVALAAGLGRSGRVLAAPPRVVAVATPQGLADAWAASGVRGRVAVMFTRFLDALATREAAEVLPTQLAVREGAVRRVLHTPPDGVWPEIDQALGARSDFRRTPRGFLWLVLDARVEIAPLSRFAPPAEPALVVVEPAVWSGRELQAIADLLRSGAVTTDLLVLVRGSEADAATFREALLGRPR